jgi:hypothetical protein
VRTARHLAAPAFEGIQPSDEREEAILGAVDVGAEVDDLGGERLDGVGIGGRIHAATHILYVRTVSIEYVENSMKT